MANDDLILILDDDAVLTLEDELQDDWLLVDDLPSVKHYDDYTGQYVVTPIFHDEQELLTDDKHMTDNVTVLPIGEEYILNRYGGLTAIIG